MEKKKLKEREGIKKLLERGKREGALTYQEVEKEITSFDISDPKEIEGIFDLLEEEGIEVREKPESSPLPSPPKTPPSTIEDYLEEIGKTPLLSEEEERALSKTIREGKEKLSLLASEGARLIEKEKSLLLLWERKGKDRRELKGVKNRLDRVREILDFLEEIKTKLPESLSPIFRKKLEKIIKAIEKIRPTYEEARKELMRSNLRLVVSFAKKFTGRGVPFLDLIQEGNVGLSRAVDRFDYRKGHRFSTYASWWIRQALSRAVADQARTIRLPVHMAELIKKLHRIAGDLQQKLGREPTLEEIAEEAKISPEKIKQALGIGQGTISFDVPVGEEEDSTMIEFIPDPTIPPPVYQLVLDIVKKEVRNLLEKVVTDERELDILRLRFGLDDEGGYSLREIGEKYGVSRERIRQIEQRALSRLREPAEKKGLKAYLELLDTLRTFLKESYTE